jgi:hypothetical protein
VLFKLCYNVRKEGDRAMPLISKETVEKAIQQIFKNAPSGAENQIEVDILISSLVSALSEGKSELTDEQKDALGKAVFFNPKVLKRLEEAESVTEEDEISNYDEYLKYKNEKLRSNG